MLLDILAVEILAAVIVDTLRLRVALALIIPVLFQDLITPVLFPDLITQALTHTQGQDQAIHTQGQDQDIHTQGQDQVIHTQGHVLILDQDRTQGHCRQWATHTRHHSMDRSLVKSR
jgi:hypothetical protein